MAKAISKKSAKKKGTGKIVPECTIPKQLLEVWEANTKKYDVPTIMKIAKKASVPSSKPVVTKALKYGHVNDTRLRDLITKYFVDRNQAEKIALEKDLKLLSK